MSNLIETKDKAIDCTNCIFFTSYQDEYQDEMEPIEYGRCAKQISEMVGEYQTCLLFKALTNR